MLNSVSNINFKWISQILILMLDAWSNSVVRSFTANLEEKPASTFQGIMASLLTVRSPGCVSHMAVCGVGLWVSMANSSTIALFRTESFIHMQDINIANNVSRVLAAREVSSTNDPSMWQHLQLQRGYCGLALTWELPWPYLFRDLRVFQLFLGRRMHHTTLILVQSECSYLSNQKYTHQNPSPQKGTMLFQKSQHHKQNPRTRNKSQRV